MAEIWKTEGERIAYMRGIYIGWERGLISASNSTGIGNLIQTVLGDLCISLIKKQTITPEIAGVIGAECGRAIGDHLEDLSKSPFEGVRHSHDGRFGSNHYLSKLTDEDVLEIREARARGVGSKSLAERYGVSQKAIWGITNGRTWKHVAGPLTKGWRRRGMDRDAKKDILSLRSLGKTYTEISVALGRGRSTVARVCQEAQKK